MSRRGWTRICAGSLVVRLIVKHQNATKLTASLVTLAIFGIITTCLIVEACRFPLLGNCNLPLSRRMSPWPTKAVSWGPPSTLKIIPSRGSPFYLLKPKLPLVYWTLSTKATLNTYEEMITSISGAVSIDTTLLLRLSQRVRTTG
jgi:hypothetical protein